MVPDRVASLTLMSTAPRLFSTVVSIFFAASQKPLAESY